ncbi:MAG: hypothetical protein GY707_05505 [Desulfobacteraceae bacterium]|nr:hypothetical protein [Desulfobacteraceae bacterium]
MIRPDKWVVLKIDIKGKICYKVLGGWSGGYLNSDSWRLNSGIAKVEEGKYAYTFIGYSGSEYICHKESYGMTVLTSDIYAKLLEQLPDSIEILDEDTNFGDIV